MPEQKKIALKHLFISFLNYITLLQMWNRHPFGKGFCLWAGEKPLFTSAKTWTEKRRRRKTDHTIHFVVEENGKKKKKNRSHHTLRRWRGYYLIVNTLQTEETIWWRGTWLWLQQIKPNNAMKVRQKLMGMRGHFQNNPAMHGKIKTVSYILVILNKKRHYMIKRASKCRRLVKGNS